MRRTEYGFEVRENNNITSFTYFQEAIKYFNERLMIKPQELWEKLAETSIVRGDASCGMSTEQKAHILAGIAEKHYR